MSHVEDETDDIDNGEEVVESLKEIDFIREPMEGHGFSDQLKIHLKKR